MPGTSQAVPRSTGVGIPSAEGRGPVWGRRAVLAVLAAFVLLGLSGLLGVHTSTASADEDGYEVSLRYAAVARAGLDVPFEVTVTTEGEFADTITLAVTADYFDIFETQGFTPDPSSAVRNGDVLYLTFDSPGGHTFKVSYDAYIQPAAQQGRSGSVGVVTADGSTVARVPFHTRLLP
jgi:hypothetical protein